MSEKEKKKRDNEEAHQASRADNFYFSAL